MLKMPNMPKAIVVAAALVASAPLAVGGAVAADAEQVFKFYCAQCHGPGGKGDGPAGLALRPPQRREMRGILNDLLLVPAASVLGNQLLAVKDPDPLEIDQ